MSGMLVYWIMKTIPMLETFFIFACSLFIVAKGATLATKYSARLADDFNVSKHVISFIIVAFIAILPETLVSVNAALAGMPEFGLGTLFGSNMADLTLIFAVLILFSRRRIIIESKVLKNVQLYPFFLALPVLFGLNGHYSRVEGIALIMSGALFYYFVFRNDAGKAIFRPGTGKYKNAALLAFSMALLLLGSHLVVVSATELARLLHVAPVLIGMLVVSLGTTMPELFYSARALKKKDDGLAIGDILGSVLADATIVVGMLALIRPFHFPAQMIYVTAVSMLVASFVLVMFMRSGRAITKKEGVFLFALWVAYVLAELVVGL